MAGLALSTANILPLSLSDKVFLHILEFFLFETLQMQPECFGAVVCSVNLSDSNLVLKYACSFANRGRGNCFEHFNLHDRGGIATCVVCLALAERHWEDLEFFAFSVWESQQCKCCYRVVNKHLWQHHCIYWKFRICLLVLPGPLFILVSISVMFEMKNICHRQREAGNSPVFESFYRNMEKQKLARSLRPPVTVLPLLKAKKGKQTLW